MTTAEAERFLLDTHVFLWLAVDDPKLPGTVRETVLRPETTLILSVASVWEMAIKASLGKLRLRLPLATLLESQLGALDADLLEIRVEHVVAVESLPWHHRDPFDRLLIAQARVEGLTILSADPAFARYDVPRFWG